MAFNDYLVAEFRQGPELRRQYQFNRELHGGICFALMCQWAKSLLADDVEGDFEGLFHDAATERMEELEEAFKLAGSRQRIYKDYFRQTKVHTWQDVAAMMTTHGRLFGIQFGFEGEKERAQIRNFVRNHANLNKLYYLSIKFHFGGGHAIGIYSKRLMKVFDPNYGEFEVRSGRTTAFLSGLWHQYAGLNGGIKRALVFSMSSQQTIFEFFQSRV